MAMVFDIEKDLRFLEGEHKMAVYAAEVSLKEGFGLEAASKITKLSMDEVKEIAKRLGIKAKS